MKNIFLIAIMFFPVRNITAQLLTVSETLEYLNNLSYENPSSPFSVVSIEGQGCMARHYKIYNITNSGNLVIDEFREVYNCDNKSNNRTFLTYKKTLHITDIDLQEMRKEETHERHIVIPCKEGNCVYIEPGKEINSSGTALITMDKSQVDVYEATDYIKQKTLNALIYLVSIAQTDEQYQRQDQEDPFAPQNFNDARYKIISNEQLAEINLIEENGVLTLWVSFGSNIERKFILDSGASEMSISSVLERELIDKGILKKEDYLPSGLYQLADGSIISARRFKVPKVTVGGFTIYNVTASVGTQNSPLLLGRSFLNKFGKWSINNESKTLQLEK